MAFLNSFEKEAGIAGTIGKAVGAPIAAIARRGQKTRTAIKSVSSEFGKGFSEASAAGRKKEIGAHLAERNVQKLHAQHGEDVRAAKAGLISEPKPVMSGDVAAAKTKAKADVLTRARKINAKPSFASRHPYATAGGAFLAGKTLFQPKKEDDTSRPAVMYPQGNY